MLLGMGGREGCTNLDPPELCFRDINNVVREGRTRGVY